ncbi:MAG: E3 binding domain-containing protein, partial [Flavobacteriaceae bacterium]
MSKFELKLPKMGESVAEATITSWLKEVGDTIEMDEPIVEIATDKVDSEVPSEVEGVLLERFFEVDDVVGVGQVIAVIETDGDVSSDEIVPEEPQEKEVELPADLPTVESVKEKIEEVSPVSVDMSSPSGKFYSPLVRNIAKKEGISLEELESIQGSGKDNRVTKNDILAYLKNGKQQAPETAEPGIKTPAPEPTKASTVPQSPVQPVMGDEVIEMTRMGKLISKHMVDSLKTSAHVQSFVEV